MKTTSTSKLTLQNLQEVLSPMSRKTSDRDSAGFCSLSDDGPNIIEGNATFIVDLEAEREEHLSKGSHHSSSFKNSEFV